MPYSMVEILPLFRRIIMPLASELNFIFEDRLISLNLTLEGPCIIFCNIYTFQRDTQCSCTEYLLILGCQLYMFRTVTVHPQELLFRCCMCRLWYVLIRPSGTTFEEQLLFPQTLYQLDISGSAFLATYHSLHIQHLKRSS